MVAQSSINYCAVDLAGPCGRLPCGNHTSARSVNPLGDPVKQAEFKKV